MVPAKFQEGTLQCVNTLQTSAWVTCVDVLVVKASHIAKPSLNRDGNYHMYPGRCDSLDSLEKPSPTQLEQQAMRLDTGVRLLQPSCAKLA